MLPSFAKKEHIGSLSGKSWAFGYAGGIICLLIILFGFVQTDTPLFGIEKDLSANIRIAGPIVAVWFIFFSIPFLLKINNFSKDKNTQKENLFIEVIKNIKSLYLYIDSIYLLMNKRLLPDKLVQLFRKL